MHKLKNISHNKNKNKCLYFVSLMPYCKSKLIMLYFTNMHTHFNLQYFKLRILGYFYNRMNHKVILTWRIQSKPKPFHFVGIKVQRINTFQRYYKVTFKKVFFLSLLYFCDRITCLIGGCLYG